jgi:hypothetical protein
VKEKERFVNAHPRRGLTNVPLVRFLVVGSYLMTPM